MRNWRHVPLALVAGLIAATSASALEVHEEREVSPFFAISANGTMAMEVTVGEVERIQVIRDESIPVEIAVQDGVLRVASPSSTRADGKVRVVVTVQRLESVALSGIWAHLAVRNIQTDRLQIALSDSSDATLDGACGVAQFSIAGSPRINAAQLACQDVDVDIRGSGHADVRASRRASIRILGSGDVDLYGGGELIAGRGVQRRVTVHQD